MPSYPKAPPRPPAPPQGPPEAVRTFGRVRAFDVACPACGAVSGVSPVTLRMAERDKRAGKRNTRSGWDERRGTWQCRECGRRWYVGLLLWSARAGQVHRTDDQVPTIAESAGLRNDLGWATEVRLTGGRLARANRVCTCATGCPMHGEDGEGEVVG